MKGFSYLAYSFGCMVLLKVDFCWVWSNVCVDIFWFLGLGVQEMVFLGMSIYEFVGLCFDLGLEKEERRKNKEGRTRSWYGERRKKGERESMNSSF